MSAGIPYLMGSQCLFDRQAPLFRLARRTAGNQIVDLGASLSLAHYREDGGGGHKQLSTNRLPPVLRLSGTGDEQQSEKMLLGLQTAWERPPRLSLDVGGKWSEQDYAIG